MSESLATGCVTSVVARDHEEPVVPIRFVLRNGQRVLQYPVKYWRDNSCGIEWRDVPVVEESP